MKTSNVEDKYETELMRALEVSVNDEKLPKKRVQAHSQWQAQGKY